MKVAIIAATGGIGLQLLEQAISAGHDVTAVARNPQNLSPAPWLPTSPPLTRPRSTPRSPVPTQCCRRSARGPRPTPASPGVRRIIVVSAAPIGTVPSPGRPHPPRHDPGDAFIVRYLADPIVKRALREHYADLARMEDVLRDSDLDWTAVRPPRLTSKPVTGRYRTALGQNIRRGLFVSRADVAHYMLSILDQAETFRRTVGIAS